MSASNRRLGGGAGADLSGYALLAGRAGGQTLNGGTAASENLVLASTANATKGQIQLGSSTGFVYDQVNNVVSLGVAPNSSYKFLSSFNGSDNVHRMETALGGNRVRYDLIANAGNELYVSQHGSTHAGVIFGENRAGLSAIESYGSALMLGINGNFPVAICTNSLRRITAEGNGNLSFVAYPVSYQSMVKGIFVGNATTAPTGNPASGGYLYSEAGALKWRGSGGTITTMGPA